MTKQYYIVFGDDGHGIGTKGKATPFIKALGRSIKENEFNEAVVLLMRDFFKDTEVIFVETAPTKDDTSLTVRVNNANKVYKTYCDRYGKENVHAVFVSVHYNALDGKFDGAGKDPEGLSIHIFPGSLEGRELAEHVLKFLKEGTKQKNRGIVQQNLAVTRLTHMPSILTENGFMDNEREALLMLDKDFQREVAYEHFQGIMSYFNLAVKQAVKVAEAPKVVTPVRQLPKKEEVKASATKSVYKDIKTTSLVDFLKGNGVDYTFANRAKLAKVYGIEGYKGDSKQNLLLLDKIRKATTKVTAPTKKFTSLVDYLNSIGVDASFPNRAKLAKQYGISGYEGTASQNTKLLNKLQK